jgi:hypothetical protein
MLAPRRADDIRTLDKAQHRAPWHCVEFSFKPGGEPTSIETKPPPRKNFFTALVENEHTVTFGSHGAKQRVV